MKRVTATTTDLSSLTVTIPVCINLNCNTLLQTLEQLTLVIVLIILIVLVVVLIILIVLVVVLTVSDRDVAYIWGAVKINDDDSDDSDDSNHSSYQLLDVTACRYGIMQDWDEGFLIPVAEHLKRVFTLDDINPRYEGCYSLRLPPSAAAATTPASNKEFVLPKIL